MAWWPSLHAVKSAEVTTPSGVSTQTFPTAPNASTPPPGRAYGAGFSSGDGSGRGSNLESFGTSR